jgi:hypothetical protein
LEKRTRIFVKSETATRLRQQAKADKLSVGECAEELLEYSLWFLITNRGRGTKGRP